MTISFGPSVRRAASALFPAAAPGEAGPVRAPLFEGAWLQLRLRPDARGAMEGRIPCSLELRMSCPREILGLPSDWPEALVLLAADVPHGWPGPLPERELGRLEALFSSVLEDRALRLARMLAALARAGGDGEEGAAALVMSLLAERVMSA